MSKFFKGQNVSNTTVEIQGQGSMDNFYMSVDIPNYCPFERMASLFNVICVTPWDHYWSGKTKVDHFGVIFQCPSCHNYYVLDYQPRFPNKMDDSLDANNPTIFIEHKFMQQPLNLKLSKYSLNKLSYLSPKFKSIYIQTMKAKRAGLNDIYPMGYRKALEYLVDGYLIKVQGLPANKVHNNGLYHNINKINNSDMVHTSTIAVWEGNDNVHDVKEDPDLNVNDLEHSFHAFVAFMIMKMESRDSYRYIKNNKNSKKK